MCSPDILGDALNVATLGVGKSLFKSPKAPQAPAALTPPTAQAIRNPSQPFRRGGQQAAGGGPVAGSSSSTLLTGPSGIDDNLLNLGKNNLLGG